MLFRSFDVTPKVPRHPSFTRGEHRGSRKYLFMEDWASLVAWSVKNLVQETRVRSLCKEDPLEKEMATLVALLGKSHGQRSLVGCSPWGRKE